MASEKITHERIIFAFLESSFTKSVGGTSLADIAGKLGIKKASLYNHYNSRDEMLLDTIRYCGEYLKKISFIPSEMDTTAKKYTADTVLKGIVHRWFKMNEREPLFQIYSFIESEKYFSSNVAEIHKEMREKLVSQTIIALNSLVLANKIKQTTPENLSVLANIFTGTMCNFLDSYLVEKKKEIRSNPETGAGELFSVPVMEPDFSQIDKFIEGFCLILV